MDNATNNNNDDDSNNNKNEQTYLLGNNNHNTNTNTNQQDIITSTTTTPKSRTKPLVVVQSLQQQPPLPPLLSSSVSLQLLFQEPTTTPTTVLSSLPTLPTTLLDSKNNLLLVQPKQYVQQNYTIRSKEEEEEYDERLRTTKATTTTTLLSWWNSSIRAALTTMNVSSISIKSTIIGSFVFLIYQIVFCLAQAATVHTGSPKYIGTTVALQLSAVGVISAGPIFIATLGHAIPAIYPASDLFLAPFLADISYQITKSMDQSSSTSPTANDPTTTTSSSTATIDNEILFLNTFSLVLAIAFGISGILCIIASRYKLANIGLFLPYSVLCGFFTTIGVLMYTLGFNVDTGGQSLFTVIHELIFNHNVTLFQYALLHHIPSVLIGILMHIVGKKHPYYVIGCILMTVIGAYCILYITNTTLQEATDQHWFYSIKSAATSNNNNNNDSSSNITALTMNGTVTEYTTTRTYYGPPLPFGLWVSIIEHVRRSKQAIHWDAVHACIPQICSLAILYLIRCSLHSAAVKKNIPFVTRSKRTGSSSGSTTTTIPKPTTNGYKDTNYNELPPPQSPSSKYSSLALATGSISDRIQEESTMLIPTKYDDDDYGTQPQKQKQQQQETNDNVKPTKKKKQDPLTLNYILERGYGYCHIVTAIVGGITVAPSVAASVTLFQLGAEGVAPQYGSCLLVIFFFVTDFHFVQYVTKPAFSCLMVLASIDMCRTWFIGSYQKTKDKMEWSVTPLLVLLAFTVGMLNAIIIGICTSMFIFVANFYHAGTVKFVGTGLSLRSTVERGIYESSWLDIHADYIQILVLQNYLFFGNIQSVSLYVVTMFDDDDDTANASNDNTKTTVTHNDENHAGLDTFDGDNEYLQELQDEYELPPKPKYLIIDFTMVTGMDTSAVDLLHELIALCKDHDCTLYFAGLNRNLRAMLQYAGIKPEFFNNPKSTTNTPINNDGSIDVSSRREKVSGTGSRLAFLPDLESALAKAEDGLISNDFHWEEKDEYETSTRTRKRHDSSVDDGFLYALQKIDEQHGLTTAIDLLDLRQYTQPIELNVGEVLVRNDDEHRGIYFVETGLLRVQVANSISTLTTVGAATASMNRYVRTIGRRTASPTDLPYLTSATSSIGHLHARTRTIGRQAARWKEEKKKQQSIINIQNQNQIPNAIDEQTFRLARIGQGWVIGSVEASNRMQRPGIHVAVSDCRLHYIPFYAIQLIEKENPALILHLYKLLSFLATKRQEATIHQLAQFVKIMTNPIPRLRGGKKELAKISLQHV